MGAVYENPMIFIKQIEQHMELIGGQLSVPDKINVINKHLKVPPRNGFQLYKTK